MTSPWQLGVIGHPIGHSLSPAMHRLFLERAGMAGDYLAYDAPPETLAMRLAALAQSGLRGLNVTIPHKRAVIPHLTRVAPDAQVIQAVNTIVFHRDGAREGLNTDIAGFWNSLPPRAQQYAVEGHTLLLGAGGASRAALAALIERGAQRLTLAVRNPDRAYDALMAADDLCRRAHSACDILLMALSDLASLGSYSLVINATSIGMGDSGLTPLNASQLTSLPDASFVYDVVYGRRPTRLIRECESLGIEACDGLWMLVRQGADAFERWTGATVNEEAARAAYDLLRA
ncbi:MAG: shikimate dehydrogenase [Vampirovibrionales bacterium]|nr:shikimate dehydrogenase [Vampirovibrionales bacterium]